MDPRFEELEARLSKQDDQIRFLEGRCAELIEEKIALLRRIRVYEEYFRGRA